jgi:uncharacterized protein
MARHRQRIPLITVRLVLAAAVLLNVAAQEAFQDTDPLILKARRFLDAMSRGDYQAATADLDETMLKLFGPAQMAAFWKEMPQRVGTFVRQTTARKETLLPYEIVLIGCDFDKTSLDARVVFDKAGRITGFQFVPSAAAGAKYQDPGYADRSRIEETDVTVGSGEWALPGTLTRPAGPGPFPGLVLVHGSGPNDRDETVGANKPFKDLALGLATKGVAVLRYEKRTRVHGSRLVADKVLASSMTVKEEVIDDAIQAVEVLRRADRVDPGRVFLLGHSLGGYLIPRIATADRKGDIAGFIIMAGATRPLEDMMVEQVAYILGLAGGGGEDGRKRLEELKAQRDRVKALSESDVGSGERIMNAGVRYWLDLRGYNPPEMAKKIERPIFVIQGERDYQVTAAKDFANWKAALGGRPEVTFKLYPKLNHLFLEGQGLPNPGEYTMSVGHIPAAVIDDLAGWILNPRKAGSPSGTPSRDEKR